MYRSGDMNDGARRCRRCKRKRLDDEPPEVQQYKTCAKCRIIERNKKNSRKPLAEETMLYGLKQFQEQLVLGNFMEEEIFFKDEFFRRFQNKPFNYEAELHEMMSNPNYSSQYSLAPQGGDELPAPRGGNNNNYNNFKLSTVPIQGLGLTLPLQNFSMLLPQQLAAAVAAAAQLQQAQLPPAAMVAPMQPPQYQGGVPQNGGATSFYGAAARQALAMPTHTSSARHNPVADEDVLGELAKLRGDGTKVDGEEFDPYSLDNVYEDYQIYLLMLLTERQNTRLVQNAVYLKEFDEEVTFNLLRFDLTQAKGLGSNDPYRLKMGGEKHARTVLLNNLKTLYVDPVMAVLNLEFSQQLTNLVDYRALSLLIALYNFVYDEQTPLEADVVSHKVKQALIYVNYNRVHHLLIIKTNYQLYEPSGHKYSLAVVAKVNELYKKLAYEKSHNPGVVLGDVSHNVSTAQVIYDRLLQETDTLGDQVQKLDQNDFIGDFVNFDAVFTMEDSFDEDDQNEDEIVDDEELMDDDDVDGVADAALVEDIAAVAAGLDGDSAFVDPMFE